MVICESISRVARFAFEGLSVERVLERADVPPFASNEPITLSGSRAQRILQRRINQSVAEYELINTLELARAVNDATIGRHSLNLVEADVHSTIQTCLEASPDYVGEPKRAVDDVLRLIIQFVSSRTNAQSDLYPYLFDPKAVEDDIIHKDLLDYLKSSSHGAITEYEVQHVGGGRIDLRLKFSGFSICIEMKVDSTKKPLSDISGCVAPQGIDLTGAPPHLSALIGHTVFDVPGDPVPRHIVTVAVPGSRTKPSDMK